MPFFTFTTSIPAANNAPASDQPLMLTNNVSTSSILNIDHYSFNNNSGGLHKQVTLPVESIPSSASGQAVLYANTSEQSQLFATTDNGGNAYQLTKFIDAQFTTFGTNTNYISPGTTLGGWTFLPGGLLFQYGQIVPTHTPGTTTVAFPVPFTSNSTVFSINITAVSTSSSTANLSSAVASFNKTSFLANTTGGSSTTLFFWTAIGT